MAAVPIWKDYFVNLGTGSSTFFRISLYDTLEVIFSGKAYKRPGETNIRVRINDICADYMANLHNLSLAQLALLTLPETFVVEVSSDGVTWTTKGSAQFLYDWSYDYDYDPATMGLSFPINGRVDSRMLLVYTGLNVSDVDATFYYKDGTTSQETIALFPTDDNTDDFSRSVRSAASGTAVIDLTGYADLDKVEIEDSVFHVVTDCARYALYYLNAFGGWDCFLIEGKSLEADTLTRFTNESVYDNRDIRNRGTRNYVNEISKGFTLHTGWLFHDKGEMMHHIINSTDVFLYDIPNAKMIPVTIPTTSCEYRNYGNNGNRLVNYTLQVEVAQNRTRR